MIQIEIKDEYGLWQGEEELTPETFEAMPMEEKLAFLNEVYGEDF